MSAAHGKRHKLTSAELDDLLDEALADRRVKERLDRHFRVDTSYDIPLLGSSSIGGAVVYIDRHLPPRLKLASGRKFPIGPGLIRHERLEQILEDVFGWKYDLAHDVATHYEHRDYRAKGADPAEVEKAYEPFIKADEHEKIKRVPTDLDLRPELADNKNLIPHIKATANKEKLDHANVAYVEKSPHPNKSCGKCAMFVAEKYGGPGCTLVKDEINAGGYCRRFYRGKLGESWS